MPKSPAKASSKTQTDTEYTFNFGRYNGETICAVPRDYIVWCKRNGLFKERPDLREGVRQYESLTLDQKEQLVKEKVSPWLWDACYDLIANHDMTLRRWELERMRTILMQKFHLDCPLRPETEQKELYSESASMRALNALLALSPRRPAHAAQLTPEEWKYLSFHVDPISHEGIWAWQPEYEIRIKAALDSVQKEHGQGGLEVARWVVRDRSAQCVSGINGSQGRYCYQWFDQSIKWFEEDPKVERGQRMLVNAF
ncbi:hypothetical protein ARMSODRAFT_964047 [Armillaria solidipes]|uniref:Uncharacterized protein n=1 Tax=Armillaria solidipes TaxID=1076256 RepID=A0A2H3BHK2_9AGAR|nr:hypothetical protein ARMSODRAFT_964047 [Armillaria solidipes]